MEPITAKIVADQAIRHRRGIFKALVACTVGGLATLAAAVTMLQGAPVISSPTVAKVIPPTYLAAYIASAATCPGLDWTLLAAVGSVESGHGSNMGPSSAGALGPMQFMPATFAEWAPGEPPEAIMDPLVAIPAAARMLCGNGVMTNPNAALAGYGAAVTAPAAGAAYAATVLDRQRQIVASGPALLNAQGVALSQQATFDAASSGLDPRLVSLLIRLGASTPITVGTLVTGHSEDVAGTNRRSNHPDGRAADITAIGGQPVSAANLSAHQIVAGLAALDPPDRPSEVGSPFADIGPSSRWFTAGHETHLHIGYDG